MDSLIINRSICASGSWYVPSDSIGFWVARTMYGCSMTYVFESTVTCRSSMISRRADWVLAEARLISSARMMLLIAAPGRNSNSPLFWL